MRRPFFVIFGLVLVLWFEFSCPAVAQPPTPQPTPTLVPPMANPPITNTEHITLSLQTEQSAEFALFAYYQAQDNATMLEQLAITVNQIVAQLIVTDPVVITETLPSGRQMAIRREFSYGDITVGLAVIALLLLTVTRFIWDASRPPNA